MMCRPIFPHLFDDFPQKRGKSLLISFCVQLTHPTASAWKQRDFQASNLTFTWAQFKVKVKAVSFSHHELTLKLK